MKFIWIWNKGWVNTIASISRKHLAICICFFAQALEERTKTILFNMSLTQIFRDLGSLFGFDNAETLILDHNKITCNTSFPLLPSLKMLSLNANKISNLSVFVRNLSASLPSLRYLSLMKNDAAPSYFNGGSLEQYQDYR